MVDRVTEAMTEETFRQFALSLPGTVESAHMNHPDFRAHGKIFATLQYPSADWGMVKLAPERQQEFVDAHPGVFVPVKGGWGRGGATSVRLNAVAEEALREAMRAAWENSVPKPKTKTKRAGSRTGSPSRS